MDFQSNAQTFLTEFCDLLGLPHPDPAVTDESENAYVFEKSLTRIKHGGSQTTVSADLYKRGCFMLETKQGASPASVARDRSRTRSLKPNSPSAPRANN